MGIQAFEFTVPAAWGAGETYGELTTTFTGDFRIAEDLGGERAVRDTFGRAIASWGGSIEHMANLAMVLNHSIWRLYETDEKLARVYDELWRKVEDMVWGDDSKFTDEEKRYFFSITD